MSPASNVTLVMPSACIRFLAASSETSEISTDVIRASGLFRARITVWAPVPQPASSTLDSAG